MTCHPQNAITEAIDRADDLLAIHRWRDELDYRVRIARLRFEVLGLPAEDQERLAYEIRAFNAVAANFGGAE
jgi:hypothetical protein